MSADIPGPKLPAGHPDREIDCQMAAEHAFQELAESIEASGWSPAEADVALLALALARVKAGMAQAETEMAIRRARESMGEDR